MMIQCISPREPHSVDVQYGTGLWAPQECKNVPDDVAKRMLRHADVYAKADLGAPSECLGRLTEALHAIMGHETAYAEILTTATDEADPQFKFYDALRTLLKNTPTGATVLIAGPTPDAPLQEVYDNLRNMSHGQIQDFIKTKFNMTASKRQYPTVDSVRAYATQLVEQYGVA